ncbi:MAG: PQQ-dependent sugar dehydrogenase [Myxococcota bacterium]
MTTLPARAAFVALVCATWPAWGGTGFPQNFTETVYASGLPATTAMAWAPDGSNRLFVALQSGQIRVVKNGALLPTPFATVTPIRNFSECGLLGITFDPSFASNGYVYVFACVSNTESQIIRYTAVGDVGTAKTTLIGGLPTVGDTHNGGGISVGPDAKLYWAIGDNRLTIGHDGDLTSLMCKVGRAHLNGSVPNDNPFYDGNGPNNDYIWARGFRNPFTHAWQPGLNRLWVNDVGGFGEQVFQVNRGDHGGWNDYGGGNQPAGYIRPVFIVPAGGSSGGCITGGAFYDGTLFPAAYRGNYFLGDFEVPGRIIRATFDANNAFVAQSVFGTDIPNIVDVDVGSDGALYYASWNLGQVFRLDYTASAQEIVLDRRNLTTVEGATAVFSVRLAMAPSANVVVTTARASGDADLSVSGGAALTFTPANWSTPQNVSIAVADDPDTTNDTATFTVGATGLTSHTVTLFAADDDEQGLVLSTSILNLVEGGSGSFTVRLANVPAVDTTVTVARTSGDADLTVASGASLTFTPANYLTPQTVSLAAAEDADTVADSATFTVAASGATSRTVTVTAQDNDLSAPVIQSTPVTRGIVGIAYEYDVNAVGLPTPTYALGTAPQDMTIDAATGVVRWGPMAVGQFAVTVRATNGQLPDATQSFTIDVAADAPPQALLTQPRDGASLSGRIELYGDGRDDAATVRAEFFVDDVMVYVDATPGDHYHYGGTNGHTLERFDTTTLANGPHVFRMTVYDAKNQSGSMQAVAVVDNPIGDGGAAGDAGQTSDGGEVSDAGSEASEPAAPVVSTCGCSSGGASLGVALTVLLALHRSWRRRLQRQPSP